MIIIIMKKIEEQMNNQINDERTNKWEMNKWTNEQTNERMKEWKIGITNERRNKREEIWKKGRINKRMSKRKEKWEKGRMKERKSERKKDRKNDRNELLMNGITNKWKYPQSPLSTVMSICRDGSWVVKHVNVKL